MKNTRVRSRRIRFGFLVASAAAILSVAGSPASAAVTATVSSGVAAGTIVVTVDGSGGFDGAQAIAVSACGNADGAGNPLPASAEGDAANCFAFADAALIANGGTASGLAVITPVADGTNYTINYQWTEPIGANGTTCVAGGNYSCIVSVNIAKLDQTILQRFTFPVVANSDGDGDGVLDDNDNCVAEANAGQEDADADGIGDACEADSDGDGVIDDDDNCVNTPNPDQADSDDPPDGIGDACADDSDGDGVANDDDNCVTTPNPDQADNDAATDETLAGDACDDDDDNDGVLDAADNCPLDANPNQVDADGDGFGIPCDEDGDVVAATTSVASPTTVATQVAGEQELAVTGVDNAPALIAAFGLAMMGLGFMTIARRREA